MKKWMIPFAYPLVFVAALCLVKQAAESVKDGWAGLAVVLYGVVIYCALVVPTLGIVYAKWCLAGQKHRLLFTLYQSFFITVPYLIFCLINGEVWYSLLLFLWCELWALLGLIPPKRRRRLFQKGQKNEE